MIPYVEHKTVREQDLVTGLGSIGGNVTTNSKGGDRVRQQKTLPEHKPAATARNRQRREEGKRLEQQQLGFFSPSWILRGEKKKKLDAFSTPKQPTEESGPTKP